MVDYTFKSKGKSYKSKNRKENTVDSYVANVTKNINGANWCDDEEDYEDSISKKYDFLKKNIKIASVIPSKTRNMEDMPTVFGNVKTNFGTISVGYQKYNKNNNSEIGFSLNPSSITQKSAVSINKIEKENVYFGGPSRGKNKKFKASNISFKYDKNNKSNIQKLVEDNDGIVDDEKKLLYQDKQEDMQIDFLEFKENEKNANKKEINKKISKLKEIKEEKEEDNKELLKCIEEFIKKMKNNDIKEYVDADEAFIRRKRILDFLDFDIENIDEYTDNQLRNLLINILKKNRNNKDFSEERVKKLDRKELKKLLKKIMDSLKSQH